LKTKAKKKCFEVAKNMANIFKLLFLSFNSAVVLTGTALVTLSLLFIADRSTARQLLSILIDDEQLVDLVVALGTKVAAITLLLGSLLAITAGSGCVGAIKQSNGMLTAYMAIVGVLILLTMSAVIFMAVNKSKVLKSTNDHLEAKLISGYDGTHTGQTGATLLIDAIQIQFNCCGIRSHEDFEKASSWENKEYDGVSNLLYPVTCCVWNTSEEKTFIEPFTFFDQDNCLKHSSEDFTVDTNTTDLKKVSNFNKPCSEELRKFANTRLSLAFAILAIVMVLASLSMFAAYTFKRKNSEQY